MLVKLNLDEHQVQLVEALKAHFGEATASKAVMAALDNFLEVQESHTNLTEELAQVRFEFDEVKEALRMKAKAEITLRSAI